MTNGEFLEPLADKIAQFVMECYRGEAFGPLSPIARKNGETERAKRLQVEEASLLLLACKHSAGQALLLHYKDPQQADMALVVLGSLVRARLERIAPDLDEDGVDEAYFDGNFPNGVFHSEAVTERLPKSELLSITVPILIDWTRFMAVTGIEVASAALKVKAGGGSAPGPKSGEWGCLLPLLLGVSFFGTACSIIAIR